MNYLSFLTWLVSLGPKLPAVLAEIQKIADSVRAILGLVGQPVADDGTLAMTSVSTAEAEAEQQVAAIMAGETGAFDGSRLRALFKFYQDNKALFDFLIGIIGGVGG